LNLHFSCYKVYTLTNQYSVPISNSLPTNRMLLRTLKIFIEIRFYQELMVFYLLHVQRSLNHFLKLAEVHQQLLRYNNNRIQVLDLFQSLSQFIMSWMATYSMHTATACTTWYANKFCLALHLNFSWQLSVHVFHFLCYVTVVLSGFKCLNCLQ